MSSSVYQKLEKREIRVLKLHPGYRGQPLEATLRHLTLDQVTRPRWSSRSSQTDYFAVSYAWGKPIFSHSLSVRHSNTRTLYKTVDFPMSMLRPRLKTGSKTIDFPITESLYEALQQFRLRAGSVHLWADQICINQSDVDERNAQVAMMADIFASAREVYVWLGLPGEHDKAAFATAKFLVANKDTTSHRIQPTLTRLAETWLPPRGHPELTLSDGLAAFSSIAQRPWFDRLWVVQEILKGRSNAVFHYGEERLLHNDLIIAFRQYTRVVDLAEAANLEPSRELRAVKLYEKVAITENWARRKSFAASLLDLLLETAHLKASDPRDRVFALRAIVNIDANNMIPVDYAISESDLWRDVARILLHNLDSTVEIALALALPATQDPSKQAASSSSWTADFGALTPVAQRKRSWYNINASRHFAGGESCRANFDKPEQVRSELRFKGIVLGQIQDVSVGSSIPLLPQLTAQVSTLVDALDSSGSSTIALPPQLAAPISELVEVLDKVLDVYVACRQFYKHKGVGVAQARCRDIVMQGPCGTFDENYYLLLEYAMRKALKRFNRSTFTEIPEESSKAVLESPYSVTLDVDEVLHDLCNLALSSGEGTRDHTRLLARISDDYLGWVPGKARLGDRICLLQGCPAPFLVRERDDGCYAIVGDAYVEGMMQGEAWPDNGDKIEIVRFK